MEGIYETNDSFDFNKLTFLTPVTIPGGNYFIKFRINDSPLYIQPPKCKTKNGIFKAGKRMYCDLMFTNENENFIRWMENLENFCQKKIYENREKWFETELDEHDIENSFTSPLKLFKSGKFYISRTNVPTILGNCSLKIYNENEEEVNIESISENSNVMTILEIQGIKCSVRSFQIEIELKQMMILKPVNLFEKCIFKNKSTNVTNEDVYEIKKIQSEMQHDNQLDIRDDISPEPQVDIQDDIKSEIENNIPETHHELHTEIQPEIQDEMQPNMENNSFENSKKKSNEDILEIEFDIDNLPENDIIKIKKRNEIYYEMYREAKRKAKLARDLAISSYLEAKHIKNTFLANDEDNDESDLDEETFEKMQK